VVALPVHNAQWARDGLTPVRMVDRESAARDPRKSAPRLSFSRLTVENCGKRVDDLRQRRRARARAGDRAIAGHDLQREIGRGTSESEASASARSAVAPPALRLARSFRMTADEACGRLGSSTYSSWRFDAARRDRQDWDVGRRRDRSGVRDGSIRSGRRIRPGKPAGDKWEGPRLIHPDVSEPAGPFFFFFFAPERTFFFQLPPASTAPLRQPECLPARTQMFADPPASREPGDHGQDDRRDSEEDQICRCWLCYETRMEDDRNPVRDPSETRKIVVIHVEETQPTVHRPCAHGLSRGRSPRSPASCRAWSL